MNPEQINVAIAKACGLPVQNNPHYGLDGKLHDSWSLGIHGDTATPIPNYHGDLNAMHEAEKVLFKDEILWAKYRQEQYRFYLANDTFSLSAAQRAEAFLRTLNLWID